MLDGLVLGLLAVGELAQADHHLVELLRHVGHLAPHQLGGHGQHWVLSHRWRQILWGLR